MCIEGQGHFLPYIFQVLYVLCFTGQRYQVSVYRTIGPLVYKFMSPSKGGCTYNLALISQAISEMFENNGHIPLGRGRQPSEVKIKNNQANIIEAFNSTSRYLDDLLNIDNPYFEGMVNQIYPPELKLNKATTSGTEAPFFGFTSIHF